MIDLKIIKYDGKSPIKEDRIFLRVTRKKYFNVISLTKDDIKELIKEIPKILINL